MAMTSCRECGHEISTSARACPKCGGKVPRTKWWLWVPLAGLAGFFALGMVVGNSPEAKARSGDRAAIAECWKQQERKALEPATARVVARMCEAAEARFRERWGASP